MEQNILNQTIVIPKQDELIEDVLNRMSNEGLVKLIEDIEDEQEMRKLKTERYIRLKIELKVEKERMLKEIKDIKIRMLKNLQEETKKDEIDDFSDEKPLKKKVKCCKK